MSGYDTLRAMRKGSDPDPDFEAWKKDINPYPRADPENDYQWQMRINAIKGDLGYGEEDENGDWVPDEGSIYPHMKQLKEEGGKENEDEYRECVERGSTYTPYEDEPDLYYAATPTPIKPTTQTTIDAHAAGGDNVWQRGQTARQQAAMARDAQQARDLARPYRMAPKVAYKQAQEEQNMEPTQKSAMPELPSISSMIKGKRENPRDNLYEFLSRDHVSKAYTPYKEGELDDINNAHIESGEAPSSKLRGWVPEDAEFENDERVNFTPNFVNTEVPAGKDPYMADFTAETPYARITSPIRHTDAATYDEASERWDKEIAAHGQGHLVSPLTGDKISGEEIVAATRLPGKVNPAMPMEDILENRRQAGVANYRHPKQPVEGVSGFGQDGKLTSTQRIVAEQVRDKKNQGNE